MGKQRLAQGAYGSVDGRIWAGRAYYTRYNRAGGRAWRVGTGLARHGGGSRLRRQLAGRRAGIASVRSWHRLAATRVCEERLPWTCDAGMAWRR